MPSRRIVTSTYRYKRPPRKKKPVLLEVPAIVTERAPRSPQASAPKPAASANDDRKPAIVTITDKKHVAQADRPLTVRVGSDVAPVAPAADRKPVIITAKRRPGRFGDVPDMTLEEHQRRGEAAGALFREIVRQATE